ncbi:peptidoglycan editing factor PgeF [uncultured Veillonella sp.]|uniref:peptidoglycan editing factor PgeF n=1 Tax=uncultured Veillonella sp. TaxID=159268 RepID=UPI0025E2D4D8|nr:peptidoglycan editing factor PgeF [uncultured Veillonella sp.]
MNQSVKRIDVKGPHGTWSYETPNWADCFPITIGDTYRHGGVSQEPYESLNLAFHVGDEPKYVRENRAIIAEYLGVEPERISCGNQVHGLNAVEITENLVGAGAFGEDTAIADCDAIFTKLPNVPLFLFTADCVAVGIYDAKHHAIATVHAGWRGAIGHLPVLTIEAMNEAYGTEFKDCYIYLGPSIGPESFEVDVELGKRFELAWHGMTDRSVADVVNYPGDKLDKAYINLWNFIAEGLMVNGVPKENIAIGGTDTVTDRDCYSYRRESAKTGRMALFSMLQER